MLCLKLKRGERIELNGPGVIHISEIQGGSFVLVAIDAPERTNVRRVPLAVVQAEAVKASA